MLIGSLKQFKSRVPWQQDPQGTETTKDDLGVGAVFESKVHHHRHDDQ